MNMNYENKDLTIGDRVVASSEFRTKAKKITGRTEITMNFNDVVGVRPGGIQNFAATLPVKDPRRFSSVMEREIPGVGDLFPVEITKGLSVRYLRETTTANAAAPVEAGAAFPEASWMFTEVEAAIQRIGILSRLTSEMLDDENDARNYFNRRLPELIAAREDSELLNGTGASGHLGGLLLDSGIQNRVQAEPIWQTILKAITDVRTNGYSEPSAIVMHPADYRDFVLTAGAADYCAINEQKIHGKPVVLSMAIASGTALTGAFDACAAIRRHPGLEIVLTNAHENDFQTGRMAMRAQNKLALAIFRPAGFCKITGSGNGGAFA